MTIHLNITEKYPRPRDLRRKLSLIPRNPKSVVFMSCDVEYRMIWARNFEYTDEAHRAAETKHVMGPSQLTALNRIIKIEQAKPLTLTPLSKPEGYERRRLNYPSSSPLAIAQAAITRGLDLGGSVSRSKYPGLEAGKAQIQSGNYDVEELIEGLGVGAIFIEGPYNVSGEAGPSPWALIVRLEGSEVEFGYKKPGGGYMRIKFTGAPDLSVNTIAELKKKGRTI